MLEEAKEFVLGLPQSAMKKVLYNAHRIASGEQNAELFKKLESSDIWEFRTLYNGIQYRLFAFWDTRHMLGSSHARHSQKDTEDTPKGDCQSRENKTGVFQRKRRIDMEQVGKFKVYSMGGSA